MKLTWDGGYWVGGWVEVGGGGFTGFTVFVVVDGADGAGGFWARFSLWLGGAVICTCGVGWGGPVTSKPGGSPKGGILLLKKRNIATNLQAVIQRFEACCELRASPDFPNTEVDPCERLVAPESTVVVDTLTKAKLLTPTDKEQFYRFTFFIHYCFKFFKVLKFLFQFAHLCFDKLGD